jgi:hypothetical protein
MTNGVFCIKHRLRRLRSSRSNNGKSGITAYLLMPVSLAWGLISHLGSFLIVILLIVTVATVAVLQYLDKATSKARRRLLKARTNFVIAPELDAVDKEHGNEAQLREARGNAFVYHLLIAVVVMACLLSSWVLWNHGG